MGPPVGKQRARVFVDKRTGKIRACTPKETAKFEKLVSIWASSACRQLEFNRDTRPWPQDQRYSLRIVVCWADKRFHDIDNVLKSVADGCNKILWADDSQVHHMAVTRVFEGEPRTEVTVEVLP